MILSTDQIFRNFDFQLENFAILLQKDRQICWVSDELLSLNLVDDEGYFAIASNAESIWQNFLYELHQYGRAKSILPMASFVKEKNIYIEGILNPEKQLIIAKIIIPSTSFTSTLPTTTIQLLDYLQQGIVLTSTNHSIYHFNQFAQNMIPKHSIQIGDRIDKIFLDIVGDENECSAFFQHLEKKKSVAVVYTFRGRNYKISAYFDEKISGNVYTFEDVTQLVDMKETIASQQYLTEIGKTTAMLVHEMRNPMTSIKGYFDLLRLDLEKSPNYLSIIENELTRLEELCTDILYLSNASKHQLVNVDMLALTKNVCQLMHMEAQQNGVDIILNFIQKGSMKVLGNPQHIKQVLINLIKNAIQAIPMQGIIEITLIAKERNLQIMIKDNGCGIEQQTLKNIFDMFYTTKEFGTGLGLPVVKKIVEQLNGTIEMESTVNVGTTITLCFPTIKEEILTKDFSSSYN